MPTMHELFDGSDAELLPTRETCSGPVALELTPELARTIYEALAFYANRFSYDPWEALPSVMGERRWSSAPNIDELTGYAQRALDEWNATRRPNARIEPGRCE